MKLSDKKRFYVTTPIYYPNARAHIGHAYTTIGADVIARWNRLKGKSVFFLTGTDEHGQKIQSAAESRNIEPKRFVDELVLQFKNLWKLLNISNDDFIRTTDKRHEISLREFLKRLWESGDIYKGEYEGLYCIPCESFFTEFQASEKMCPECGRKLTKLKEEAYFFRLSKYQQKLLDLYEKNPEFLSPRARRTEMINRVKKGLKDLCITRTSVKWGVKFPYDKKHTIYVWIDALPNYITALGYPNGKKFKDFWPANIHIIGKEINWFHSVIWPALLMSAGVPLPKKIFVHGWWTVEGEKMSKSKGNVIDPVNIVKKYGVDQFRYFLMREISFGSDGDFSEERFVQRINSDLADGLGNLVSRTLAMAYKYFDGKVPPKRINKKISKKAIKTAKDVSAFMEVLKFQEALQKIWSLITECNQYINKQKPWKNENNREEVVYTLLESLRFIATLLQPFIPESSEKILKQICLKESVLSDLKVFGKLKPNSPVQKGGVLFKKVKI